MFDCTLYLNSVSATRFPPTRRTFLVIFIANFGNKESGWRISWVKLLFGGFGQPFLKIPGNRD
jgi:hypothetical protein